MLYQPASLGRQRGIFHELLQGVDGAAAPGRETAARQVLGGGDARGAPGTYSSLALVGARPSSRCLADLGFKSRAPIHMAIIAAAAASGPHPRPLSQRERGEESKIEGLGECAQPFNFRRLAGWMLPPRRRQRKPGTIVESCSKRRTSSAMRGEERVDVAAMNSAASIPRPPCESCRRDFRRRERLPRGAVHSPTGRGGKSREKEELEVLPNPSILGKLGSGASATRRRARTRAL